jgi:hypothetical protein
MKAAVTVVIRKPTRIYVHTLKPSICRLRRDIVIDQLDKRTQNALIIALHQAMKAKLNIAGWKKLGYTTGTIDWIMNHPRLLPSLKWEDSDYDDCIFDAIQFILKQDPANLRMLLQFDGIEEWIRENQPLIYADVLADTLPPFANISDAQEMAIDFDIDDHIKRIREALPDDPALALGSTKELIESVMKTILGLHGANIGAEDMPTLLKRVQAKLGLDPKGVETAILGGESFRRLLGNLTQIVVSIAELRNKYGTGHGKSKAPGLDPAAARLAVGAGTSLAAYLMERYESLKDTKGPSW